MSQRYTSTSSRRQVISRGLGSLAGLSLLGLAGCDTASAQPPVSSGPISLKMFFWGSATRNKLTGQAIDLFHQSNPNVTITSQYSGNDTYYTKLDAKISNGDAPDLIQMDMRYIAHYVRNRTLLDLTQYIYNQTIDLSDFDPVLLNSSKVNNTIYGIPLGSNYHCMFYDKTQFEKANMGLFPTNMTWESFAQYATELSNRLGKGTYGTSDNSGNYDTFEIWVRQRNKELYTRDGNLGFELGDIADWYNYWNNLRKVNGCLPADIQATLDLTKTPIDSSVIRGKAVFGVLFSNQYDAFQGATKNTLAMALIPTGNVAGLYLKTSQLLSISATTKHPVEAADFASFVINNGGAVKALGFERGLPGSLRGRALLAPLLTPAQQTIAAFMSQVEVSSTRPKEVLEPPAAGQIATLLLKTAQEIGLGKISVSDGANTFYTSAQKATVPQ